MFGGGVERYDGDVVDDRRVARAPQQYLSAARARTIQGIKQMSIAE
jgi:hypothetical protein